MWPRYVAGSAGQSIGIWDVRHIKVCVNDTFPFSRIESNQHTAMTLWKQSGNGYGWFALRLNDNSVYMIDHDLMIALSLNQSSIGEDLITHYGVPLERWLDIR